jgi:rubrerythrin
MVTIESAILSALDFENRVRDHYHGASEKTAEPQAKGFFSLMAREEQGHVDYLEAKLAQWGADGKIQVEEIAVTIPEPSHLGALGPLPELAPEARNYAAVAEYLHQALNLEHEVSNHYRRLIAEVNHPDSETMFRRFLEIEDGHTALVQAEIDAVTKTGYFFGFQEFNMDG